MNPADPIILTAYLLCIAYFISRIIQSFNDEFSIQLDEKALKQSLTEKSFNDDKKLDDVIGISFGFDKRYEFDKLKQLSISISNKSSDHSIYVDWDYSALTDLGGRARRVTRLMPGTTTDLFQNQVFSTVAPNTTLKENITAEDLLQRKKEPEKDSPLNLEYEVSKPLIDFKADKKKYEKFMKRAIELEFFLNLAFRLVGPSCPLGGERFYVLCRFILKKYPWTVGLPWNPKN
ncbi:MAG: hypothetical protein K6T90_04065 [Leptolyngbyaceae cyanobacterium HOT.MB2.61]|jgi:hypothetical protein|nr:hypothetical protein [Leptolyngbyaceae cyanobacterium HOT.MB2.61]